MRWPSGRWGSERQQRAQALVAQVETAGETWAGASAERISQALKACAAAMRSRTGGWL